MNCTRYGLGARGIDWIETSVSGNPQTSLYPLYDGHGNMIATISLSGTLSNLRAYDPFDSLRSLKAGAWGGVRDQAEVTTDPNTRYCANLGHKQDDESGLIYMRARFYDAGTGRFISQDPAMHGANWFVYCNNDPVNRVDATGNWSEWDNVRAWYGLGIIASLSAVLFGGMTQAMALDNAAGAFYPLGIPLAVSMGAGILAVYAFSRALGATHSQTVNAIAEYTNYGANLVARGVLALVMRSVDQLSRLQKCLGDLGLAAATYAATWMFSVTAALIWAWRGE